MQIKVKDYMLYLKGKWLIFNLDEMDEQSDDDVRRRL
jgi:hypothetical protein